MSVITAVPPASPRSRSALALPSSHRYTLKNLAARLAKQPRKAGPWRELPGVEQLLTAKALREVAKRGG